MLSAWEIVTAKIHLHPYSSLHCLFHYTHITQLLLISLNNLYIIPIEPLYNPYITPIFPVLRKEADRRASQEYGGFPSISGAFDLEKTILGSFPLPVTVLKGALLGGFL